VKHVKQEPEGERAGIWVEVVPHRRRIVYRHDDCPRKHRTQKAADDCNPYDDGGGIYILHFDRPLTGAAELVDRYGGPLHYVGLAQSFRIRLDQHRTGKNASAKTKLALELGISFQETLLTLEATTKNETHVTQNVEQFCAACADGAPTGPLRPELRAA
jgi:glutaredoxin